MSERINNEVFCFCFCSVCVCARVPVCACLYVCACVCMRVGLVQAATSANTLWKTNSVGVDGISRQRSSSDLPAVHPPLPPLRVTSTSTFFFLLFPFLPGGLMNLEDGAPLATVGCTQIRTRCCPHGPNPCSLCLKPPIHSLATLKMAHSLFCLTRYFNSIHT